MARAGPIRPARELLCDAGDASRDTASLVDEIAGELNLLSQSHINPGAFLERRDMLAKRLRRLARRLRGDTTNTPTTVWRAPGKSIFPTFAVDVPMPRTTAKPKGRA